MNKVDMKKFAKSLGNKPKDEVFDIMRGCSIFIKQNLDVETMGVSVFSGLNLSSDPDKLFQKGFKKLFSGRLHESVFNFDFADASRKNILKTIADSSNESDFKNNCVEFGKYFCEQYKGELKKDVVLNFLHCKMYSGDSKMVMITLNKAVADKSRFLFIDKEKGFKSSNTFKSVVSITSPMEGVMYPNIDDESPNLKTALYYSGKKNQINIPFVEDLLGLDRESSTTAQQEEMLFEDIVEAASEINNGFKPEDVNTIFQYITEKDDMVDDENEEEKGRVYISSIKEAFEEVGVDMGQEQIKPLFDKYSVAESYINMENAIPNVKSALVKVDSSELSLKVKADMLDSMKVLKNKNQEKFLVVKIDSPVLIDSKYAIKEESTDLDKLI